MSADARTHRTMTFSINVLPTKPKNQSLHNSSRGIVLARKRQKKPTRPVFFCESSHAPRCQRHRDEGKSQSSTDANTAAHTHASGEKAGDRCHLWRTTIRPSNERRAHPPPSPSTREGLGPQACLSKWGRAPPPPVVGPVAQGFRPANPKLVLLPRRNSNGAGTLAPSTTHRPPRGSSWHTMLIHGAPALHAGGRRNRAVENETNLLDQKRRKRSTLI